VLALIDGVVNELALTADCVWRRTPPEGESYHRKVPDKLAEADKVAVGFPHVDPAVTVIDGGEPMVAVTAARPLVHVPLLNST
jgi:hypothetical protein